MEERIITWGVFTLLLVLSLVVLWPLIKRWQQKRRLERLIAADGVEQLRDVLIDDGMSGLTYFEWVLLTPSAIRVVMLNPRSGVIFAGERMDSWAQVIGKRTRHFANPLRQLDDSLATLRYHLPKLPLEGELLFTGQCEFPKGRPERIRTLPELQADRKESLPAVQPVLESAWQGLKKKMRVVDPKSEGYLLPVRDETSPLPLVFAVILSLAAVGWLLWRLVGS